MDDRLACLRDRLLDATRRNPLLNLRRAGCIPLSDPGRDLDRLLQAGNDEEQDPLPLVTVRRGRGLVVHEECVDSIGQAAEEAQRYRAERGAEITALAWGQLAWTDAPGEEPTLAPLVVLPVRLRQAQVGRGWAIEVVGDPRPNPALRQRLARQGLRVPLTGPLVGVSDVVAHLAQWQAIALEMGWALEAKALNLGSFGFDRIALWEDLDPVRWQGLPQPLVERLIGEVVAQKVSATAQALEQQAADLPAVVDLDHSQRLAVARVLAGEDLVIQGPPGTGKSQTIVALVAEAVRQEQTVLVLAEKPQALTVIARRLEDLGLEDLVWDLRKAHDLSRRDAFGAVADTWSQLTTAPALELATPDPDQADRTATLDAYHAALTTPVEGTGLTIPAAQALLMGQPPVPPEIQAFIDACPTASLLAVESAWRARETLALDPAFPGPPPTEQRGVRWHPVATLEAATALMGAITRLKMTLRVWDHLLHSSRDWTLPHVEAIVGIQDHWNEAQWLPVHSLPPATDDEATVAHDAAWREAQARTAPWRQALTMPVASAQDLLNDTPWWRRWAPAYRRLAHALRLADPSLRTHRHLQEALRDLAHADHLERELTARRQGWGTAWPQGPVTMTALAERRATVARWQGWATALGVPVGLLAEIASLKQFPQPDLAAVQAAWAAGHAAQGLPVPVLPPDMSTWARVAADWQAWADAPHGHAWAAWNQARAAIAALIPATCPVPLTGTTADLERAHAVRSLAMAPAQFPVLATWNPWQFDQIRRAWQDEDRELQDHHAASLIERHRQHIPAQGSTLYRALARRRGMLPLRRLLDQHRDQVPDLLRVKPVVLSSPLAVATHLPPGVVTFDLVIVDEASQVLLEDALGALRRGRQIVVVGDDRQLPPTSFFRATPVDSLEGAGDESPSLSLLDACREAGLPQTTLRWHYRSRHHQLIHPCNHGCYGGQLVTFPNPARRVPGEGLSLVPTPGVYGRGTDRANPMEAAAVIAAAVDHLRSTPEHSLGIIACSQAQRKALMEAWVERLRREPDLSELLHQEEPFFITNLEQVQGDEREVILFSLGYGRSEDGTLARQFGPISQIGGERRLNVALSRARRRLAIFTDLTPEDLDDLTAAGPVLLREALAYARDGQFTLAPVGAAHQDPVLKDLIDALRQRGLTVHAHVGDGPAAVDAAVVDPRNPDHYCLGILTDGPAWQSSPRRDRERLREEVLLHLGWTLRRVWRWEWATTRRAVIEQIVAHVGLRPKT